MKKVVKVISVATAAAVVLTSGSLMAFADGDAEKTTITFWHTWSGSEADALQAVVDDFNNSQDKVHVEVLSSQTEDKMLTAVKTLPYAGLSGVRRISLQGRGSTALSRSFAEALYRIPS